MNVESKYHFGWTAIFRHITQYLFRRSFKCKYFKSAAFGNYWVIFRIPLISTYYHLHGQLLSAAALSTLRTRKTPSVVKNVVVHPSSGTSVMLLRSFEWWIAHSIERASMTGTSHQADRSFLLLKLSVHASYMVDAMKEECCLVRVEHLPPSLMRGFYDFLTVEEFGIVKNIKSFLTFVPSLFFANFLLLIKHPLKSIQDKALQLFSSHHNTSFARLSSHRRVWKKMQQESMMRGSIKMSGKAKTSQGRAAQIFASRVVFRWLPVVCSNDLVHGSWYTYLTPTIKIN